MFIALELHKQALCIVFFREYRFVSAMNNTRNTLHVLP